MVVLPYIGTKGKLKFQFSLSVSTQFDFYQHQSGEHVESYIIKKKICKTSVILKFSPSCHVFPGVCTVWLYFHYCVTNCYLSQQYIIMQTIKRLAY